MTLSEYYDELKKHDWFYAMSDSHSVYLAGNASRKRLDDIAKVNGPEFKELQNAVAMHHFSGPVFGTEKAPMPERPVEQAA